jgi:nicotinate-nucleotide pyrophosphorylase (carboxylating)
MDLSRQVIQDIVHHALREDISQADLTTLAVVPADARAEAQVVVKESGVVAGMPVLRAVFEAIDPRLTVSTRFTDGDKVRAGETLALVMGHARGILTGERVALNFLQRMSGIATITAQYVAAVEDFPVRILDTRKTTPGLRMLEKYAVSVGGGVNHRFGLYDAIMLKDNHLTLMASLGYSFADTIQRARNAVGPMVRIEIEVETVEQARAAAEAGADIILLDNMSLDELRRAVETVGTRVPLEASGGITLETIRAVAETGVHYISVGALTHSARALDISLDLMTH